MIITALTWAKIFTKFTEGEKTSIFAATTGKTSCPKGITVDESALSDAILVKLREAA